MQIFVSWSGNKSKSLAELLRQLLPDILQNVTVWMSEHDLQAGVRWSAALSEILSKCDVGIACLTQENLTSPWLMFEAGAISKSLEYGRLIPLLLGVGPEQITYPLAQFQLLNCDRNGIERLSRTLNSLSSTPIDEARLLRQIERCWSDFESGVHRIGRIADTTTSSPERSDKEILVEILNKIRTLASPAATANLEADKIWVDTRPFLGEGGKMIPFDEISQLTASDFLDEIWRHIVLYEDVPAYSYGETWMLFNAKSQQLAFVGKKYIQSRGKVRDHRTLDKLHIKPGDILEVRKALKIEI